MASSCTRSPTPLFVELFGELFYARLVVELLAGSAVRLFAELFMGSAARLSDALLVDLAARLFDGLLGVLSGARLLSELSG